MSVSRARIVGLAVAAIVALTACGARNPVPLQDTLGAQTKSPVATTGKGGTSGGDTWYSYAQGFFGSNCNSCHSSVSQSVYNSYAAVTADASRIQTALSSGMMPLGQTLDPTAKARIMAWFTAGEPEGNPGDASSSTTGDGTTGSGSSSSSSSSTGGTSGSTPAMCTPCQAQSDCGSGYCLPDGAVTTDSFCAPPCASAGDCPSGASCLTLYNYDNQAVGSACYPSTLTCVSGSGSGSTTAGNTTGGTTATTANGTTGNTGSTGTTSTFCVCANGENCPNGDGSQCPPPCTCPNGAACPNGDSSQCSTSCTCPNGTACPNGDSSQCTTSSCTCPNGTACPNGDSSQCPASCTSSCSAGQTQCSGTELESCEVQANGCYAWATTSCGSGKTCSNGACVASCTNACTAGATQCSGSSLETCDTQSNGCTAWTTSSCPSGESCTNGACAASACTTETWVNFGKSFFSNNCTQCHGSFGTQSTVKSQASQIESKLQSGSMPPGGGLSQTEINDVVTWLKCGAP